MRYIFFEETPRPTRIRNSRDLRDAFTEEEWVRIVYYFVQLSNRRGGASAEPGSFGNNGLRVARYIETMQRTIGSKMSPMTPSSYKRRAVRYGITFPQAGIPTWGEIYNHLRRGLEQEEMPPHYYARLPGSASQFDDTPETTISDWVDPPRDSWDDVEEMKQEYFLPWMRELRTRRNNEWWQWYMGENTAGNEGQNVWRTDLENHVIPKFSSILQDNESITKLDVDRLLFSWLQMTDSSWQRFKDNN